MTHCHYETSYGHFKLTPLPAIIFSETFYSQPIYFGGGRGVGEESNRLEQSWISHIGVTHYLLYTVRGYFPNCLCSEHKSYPRSPISWTPCPYTSI